MRRWIPLILIAPAAGWFVLNNVGSSMALADYAARPIFALAKGDQRIPVQQPPAPVPEDGTARAVGGTGIAFGYRFNYMLPDGSVVTCDQRFRRLSCANGWTAERHS